ncbi:hypothetical protein ACFQ0B_41575 [Nonomuraea thailandensis]
MTPRWLLPAGLGLLVLLVGLTWAQTSTRGCDCAWPAATAWSLAGGAAFVAACLVIVRTAPRRPAEVAASWLPPPSPRSRRSPSTASAGSSWFSTWGSSR